MEKIIHQIWVGPYDIPVREKSFIENLKNMNPTWEHKLWTNDNLPNLPDNIQEMYDVFERQKDYAHQADILRVFLLKEYGGLYMDVDFKCSEGFDSSKLDEFDGFFCYHGGNDYTMPNGVFGSVKNSPIINYLTDLIDYKSGGWYGPSWLGDSVKKFFNLEREVSHELVENKLKEINFQYILFYELERKHIRHHALYSWSPENKKNFETGNINYLK
jgi:mannosyltransferase OCH1-like enzyme